MTEQTPNIIICENLVKIYKVADLEVVALQGLDLVVPRGEMLGIVGTSGSGKSTLMNILGGLDRPSAGRIMVDDIDLLSLSESAMNLYQRSKVGFVWQQTGRNLIPYLTAIENVEFPMTMAHVTSLKEKREWAEELLQAIGLYERRAHYLTQLSGGEQQRVAIAVALANKPVLLLGDEPTGEVDSMTAQAIMNTFRRLNQLYNLTTIIVTHDPRIAEQVDRVVAIRDGKISTETIRQVSQLEHAMVGDHQDVSPNALAAQEATYHEYVVLDSAGRLQIPKELREEYGFGKRAQMETGEDFIIIRPVAGESQSSAKNLTIEEQIAMLFAEQKPQLKKGSQKKLGQKKARK
jgi:ABC-type lipoprotein export system ATPase subunit/bifunctional DNA-binding transcriptional regulator/antitoxin component of YhaV-PrlF toxin-antitoxin module